MTSNDATIRTRVSKAALAIGFLALTVAVLTAHRNPATGYELSILDATPSTFWMGVVTALFLSLVVAFQTRSGLRTTAYVLGGSAVLMTAALPLIRGYYYYGVGDSMTHLGWAAEIQNGVIPMTDVIYPAVHAISVFISDVAGVELRQAVMLAVIAFVAVFLVFVPLVVRAITGDDRAVLLAVFSAFLLLPINHIAVKMFAHPTSQAIMFLPVVLFLLVAYTTNRDSKMDAFSRFTAIGVMLTLALLAFVLLHPQQATNLLLLLGSVAFVQFIYRRFRSNHQITHHRPVYSQFVVLAGAFFAWSLHHDMFGDTPFTHIQMVLTSPEAAAVVGDRGNSLLAVGASLEEIFLKLFLAGALFTLAAGVLATGSIFHRLDERRGHENAHLLYLSAALIPIGAYFMLYMLGNVATMYFRHLGFIMVLVTILGTIAIYRGLDRFADGLTASARTITVVAFIALFALSLPAMFMTPWLYLPSHQVTESQYEGFQTAFDQRQDGVFFTGIRGSGDRYAHAIMGTETGSAVWYDDYAQWNYQQAPDGFTASSLVDHYQHDHYLTVTESNRATETELYNGFRYPSESFESLQGHSHVDRVQDSGGVELYLVQQNEG